MTDDERAELTRRIRDLARAYEHWLSLIEKGVVQRGNARVSGRDVALEAHARAYAIDPLLTAIGWTLESPEKVVVEDAAEPLKDTAGETQGHRRFLDYHGRDLDQSKSLVIIEAKRPSFDLPKPDKASIAEFLSQGLAQILSGQTCELPGDWAEWLKTLIDYANRIKRQYDCAPKCAAITNGQWYVVFREVPATILAGTPAASEIVIFHDLQDVANRCDEFYKLLAYPSLAEFIPPQHPAALPNFVAEGQTAVCARAIELCHVSHGEQQPLVSARVAAWVRSDGGAWVLFRKNDPRFTVLPNSTKETRKTAARLIKLSDNLVSDLGKYRALTFVSAGSFKAQASASIMKGASWKVWQTALAVRRSDSRPGQEYVLFTLGEAAVHLTNLSDYARCPYHYWVNSDKEGNGCNNILAPTCEPRAYYPSGSPYHCSHAAVHALRASRCVLIQLDSYLCCRHCALFDYCWPGGGKELPCRTGK